MRKMSGKYKKTKTAKLTRGYTGAGDVGMVVGPKKSKYWEGPYKS